MSWVLFSVFVVVPLVEIVLFIVIGERIGVAITIILVIFTAFLGSFLLQQQGFSTYVRAQKALSEGRVPVDSVIDGVCLLFAGAFLLTPGFLTDSVGFLLFVPGFRRVLAKWVFERMKASKSVQFEYHETTTQERDPYRRSPGGNSPGGQGPVIDGEFERKEDKPETTESGVPVSPRKDSPWRDEGEKK